MYQCNDRVINIGLSVCNFDFLESVFAWPELLLSAKLSNGLLCDARMRGVTGIGVADPVAVLPWLESLGAVANNKNYSIQLRAAILKWFVVPIFLFICCFRFAEVRC